MAIATSHENVYDTVKEWEVSGLTRAMEEIQSRNAFRETISVRVKWQVVRDKCSEEFFKSLRLKNNQTVMTELNDSHSRTFTRIEDLDWICYDFYKKNLWTQGDFGGVTWGGIHWILDNVYMCNECVNYKGNNGKN